MENLEKDLQETAPEQENELSAEDILLEEILREHSEETVSDETMVFQMPFNFSTGFIAYRALLFRRSPTAPPGWIRANCSA